MGASTNTKGGGSALAPSKRAEFLTFLALAFGVWPFVAVGVVGGFGFAVWIFQMIFGPPGPPAVPH